MATATQPLYTWQPIAALLCGAALWGIAWYPMRGLETAGLSGLWLNLVLYSTASLVGALFAWRHFAALRRQPLLMVAILVTAGWTNLAFILAVLNGNIMRVLLLFYLSPVWAILISGFFLKEHIGAATWGILAIAIGGAMTMLIPPSNEFPWPRDSSEWLALSSGFAFACSNALIRSAHELPVTAKSHTVWLGTALVSALLIAVTSPPVPDWNVTALGGAIALGISGVVAMTWLVQFGVSHLPLQRSAIILLFELVVAAISQQMLTNETMSVREWLGGAMVVGAALISAIHATGNGTTERASVG